MTNADLIASSIAGFFLLIVGIVLLVQIRRGAGPTTEAPVLDATEPADELPIAESPEALDSLQNLEFRVEDEETVEFSDESHSLPMEEEEEAIAAEITETETSGENDFVPPPVTESTFPVTVDSEQAQEAFVEEETAEAETETEPLSTPEPAISEETLAPTMEEDLPPEIEVSETETISAETTEESPEELLEEEPVSVEDESPVAEEEELRRLNLRPSPSRKRREPQVSEALDSQITQLDHRLDALEALVASIEESLADFDPLLDEESASGDDHAAAA